MREGRKREKEKIEGRKDIKGNAITRNVVANEARKIAFRSDDYNLDSKCRFPQIVSEIPLDTDEFIKAIEDAIKAEQSKSGKSFEESKSEQEAAEAEKMKEIAKAEKAKKAQKSVDEVMEKVLDFIKENKSNMATIKPIVDRCKEHGAFIAANTDIHRSTALDYTVRGNMTSTSGIDCFL